MPFAILRTLRLKGAKYTSVATVTREFCAETRVGEHAANRPLLPTCEFHTTHIFEIAKTTHPSKFHMMRLKPPQTNLRINLTIQVSIQFIGYGVVK